MNDLGASPCLIEAKEGYFLKEALPDFSEELRQEIRWLMHYAPSNLALYLPQILDFSLSEERVFLKTRFYNYPTLRSLILSHTLNAETLQATLKHIITELNHLLYIEEASIRPYTSYAKKTHVLKLKNRLNLAIERCPELQPLLLSNELVINGCKVLGLRKIIALMEEHEREFDSILTPKRLFLIHGDLHLNNILYNVSCDHFILLDPRGTSPGGSVQCDIAYDIAKLLHDLHGKYSLIQRGYFDVKLENGTPYLINFQVHNNAAFKTLDDSWKRFRNIVPLELKKKMGNNWFFRSLFIEALLFCTMLPFYSNNKKLQLAFLSVGLLYFQKIIKKLDLR